MYLIYFTLLLLKLLTMLTFSFEEGGCTFTSWSSWPEFKLDDPGGAVGSSNFEPGVGGDACGVDAIYYHRN